MTVQHTPPGDLQSVPALLARNVARFGDRPAYREKEYGIWQSWTWTQAADEIRALAMGLMAQGLAPGAHVADGQVGVVGQHGARADDHRIVGRTHRMDGTAGLWACDPAAFA